MLLWRIMCLYHLILSTYYMLFENNINLSNHYLLMGIFFYLFILNIKINIIKNKGVDNN